MPSAPSPRRQAGPGRPKSAQKRHAILQAAQRLFLANGFEGTSVDQIAAEAGVSKLTVYSHFSGKEALFFAAVEERCREQLPDALFATAPAGPIRERLLDIGLRFHTLLASEDAVALHRMLMRDPRTVERLGELLWNAGPAVILASLEAVLATAVARRELEIERVGEAARQFLWLLKGDINLRMLCGPAGGGHGEDGDDGKAHVASVVTMFLRAYGPR